MTPLYITSTNVAGGKTALCAGLADQLKARGKSVGYMKPLAISDNGSMDPAFMKKLLALQEPAETMSPVKMGAQALKQALDSKQDSWINDIKSSYATVSKGKEVVILEGSGEFAEGSAPAQAAIQIVNSLGARAILIVGYRNDLQPDKVMAAARMFGSNLLGVVMNAVPQRSLAKVKASLVRSLEQSGVKVLGVLPEDRLLLTFSVKDLADYLQGDILNNQERSEELVEAVMVGALSVDPAPTYLGAKQNKAVVTRGNRPDIQLAALATSTRCVVLTEGIQPLPIILNRAQEKKTPLMVVKSNTIATMEAIDGIFDKTRFSQQKKLDKINALLQNSFDLEAIYKTV